MNTLLTPAEGREVVARLARETAPTDILCLMSSAHVVEHLGWIARRLNEVGSEVCGRPVRLDAEEIDAFADALWPGGIHG